MSSGLIDTRFVDALATSDPTPGGGSASAMAAAIAAGLLSMVCSLTVGQEKFADVQESISATLAETEALRHSFIALAEKDMAAYGSFVVAQRLPRGTAEQRTLRTREMQAALRECTLVPLRIAQACRRLLELAPIVARDGNPSAVTDVGVGVALAAACLEGSALQVRANLGWVKDEDFRATQAVALEAVLFGLANLKQAGMDEVERVLAG